jgi:cytochrome c
MLRLKLAISLVVVAALAASTPARAQNADAGKAVFRQVCATCHAATPGKTLIGPTMFGIAGRKTGLEPGYQYSDGNRSANLTWDDATLFRYLENPRVVIPGTKMTYAGLKDEQKRRDLIAYLDSLK